MSAEDNVGGDDSVSQVLQYYCGYIFISYQKIFAAFCLVYRKYYEPWLVVSGSVHVHTCNTRSTRHYSSWFVVFF